MYKAKLIPLTISFLLGFGAHMMISGLTENAGAETITSCPENTYQIGGTETAPVCKQNPTGCPYAENIPVDSPKCVAPTPEQLEPFIPSEPATEVQSVINEEKGICK